jgi:hypothetical protein
MFESGGYSIEKSRRHAQTDTPRLHQLMKGKPIVPTTCELLIYHIPLSTARMAGVPSKYT